MKFLHNYFSIGLSFRVVRNIALSLLVGGVLMGTMSSAQEVEPTLQPPDFPNLSQLPNYGEADYGWTLRTVDGKMLTLSRFEGKVVFINFWATWCGPCVAEFPSIQRLYDSLKDEDVVFLIISDEDAKPVRNFLNEKGYTFPVYLQKPWWLNRLLKPTGVSLTRTGTSKVFKTWGIPITFIINRDGRIVFKHMGAVKWDDESCLSFIRSLM